VMPPILARSPLSLIVTSPSSRTPALSHFFSLVQDLIAREALSRWQFLHLEVE